MIDTARTVMKNLAALGVSARNLAADSRGVRPGDVFLAYPGARTDGRCHVRAALAAGASGVVWERAGYTWPSGLPAPNVAVDRLRELSGYLAHLVYGRPSEKLWTIGVSGTNGKTSVAQWIARSLEALGRRCAVIGTLGSGFPDALDETANTTPEAVSLHASLARYRAAGASACAMEVSSIGLDQGRVNGVAFAAAVLTNLTRDHLEYHGTMEAYGQAKVRLFLTPGLRAVVLNLDDPFGRMLAARLKGSGVRRIGYTVAEDVERRFLADELYMARDIAVGPHGVRFVARTPHGDASLETRLLGRFNVSNLLAVLASLGVSGIALNDAVRALRGLTPPPGRMQMIGGDARPLAVVDYAHTPDALEQALTALREVADARGGKLFCVFGCGGERDPGKRSVMGEAAARRADRVFLTSDNPRSEDPQAILDQIRDGAGVDTIVIEDRAAAIARALRQATAADVVLIAGKGHEPYQEVRGERRPFSDSDEACRGLRQWGGAER